MLLDHAMSLMLAVGFLANKQAGVQPLPPPRPVPVRAIVGPVVTVHPFFEPGPYMRRSLYARDRYGYFRPRVIYGPDGAFYPLTGQPYPYTPIKGIP